MAERKLPSLVSPERISCSLTPGLVGSRLRAPPLPMVLSNVDYSVGRRRACEPLAGVTGRPVVTATACPPSSCTMLPRAPGPAGKPHPPTGGTGAGRNAIQRSHRSDTPVSLNPFDLDASLDGTVLQRAAASERDEVDPDDDHAGMKDLDVAAFLQRPPLCLTLMYHDCPDSPGCC